MVNDVSGSSGNVPIEPNAGVTPAEAQLISDLTAQSEVLTQQLAALTMAAQALPQPIPSSIEEAITYVQEHVQNRATDLKTLANWGGGCYGTNSNAQNDLIGETIELTNLQAQLTGGNICDTSSGNPVSSVSVAQSQVYALDEYATSNPAYENLAQTFTNISNALGNASTVVTNDLENIIS